MDRFRTNYRELSEVDRERIKAIKMTADALEANINEASPEPSREKSLAITKLEESVMWAVKGITG
jgi:hypothetical protein